MKRIKTVSGFFREVRPRAGVVTLAMMFFMSFVAGAVGLLVAMIYCLPIPVTLVAFMALGKGLVPVILGTCLIGGGSAMALLMASMIQDAREEARQQALRASRMRRDPGPWGVCVIRQDRLRDSIMQTRSLAVVPRRWR